MDFPQNLRSTIAVERAMNFWARVPGQSRIPERAGSGATIKQTTNKQQIKLRECAN
jgi:hypothetical protein